MSLLRRTPARQLRLTLPYTAVLMPRAAGEKGETFEVRFVEILKRSDLIRPTDQALLRRANIKRAAARLGLTLEGRFYPFNRIDYLEFGEPIIEWVWPA